MDAKRKNLGSLTPTKSPQVSKSKMIGTSKVSENLNPNFSSSSPVSKSAKSQKSKNPDGIISPSNIINKRRFVIAKKNTKKEKKVSKCCKCKEKSMKKCLCVAYESLRASHEEFVKEQRSCNEQRGDGFGEEKKVEEEGFELNLEVNGLDKKDTEEIEVKKPIGSINERRKSVCNIGAGRVLNLVKAFEGLLSEPPISKNDDEKDPEENSNDDKNKDSDNGEVIKRAMPAFQPEVPAQESLPSFCSSNLILTSGNLGLDTCAASSCGSSQRRDSGGSRRSRRNRLTSQKPFRLETEERGRLKEEELLKKIQNMMEEQERQRIPIAQGLPWTTDEPQRLVKPPVKENTKPPNLKLHSDVRAVERAEFDQQVTEKMIFIEQYKLQRERERKLAEEEEIKRLRMELVPKAQPMPYFDKPFMPKKSMKHPTVPKEPKFLIPDQQRTLMCCSSTAHQ